MIARMEAAICHPTKNRRLLGLFTYVAAISMAAFVWWSVKQDTKRLAAEQELCAAIIDNDGQPSAMLDEHGCIVKWNAGMEELTGVSAEAAKESGLAQVICDPLRERKHEAGIHEAFQHQTARGQLVQVHCSILNAKTGARIPVCVSARILSINGDKFAIARIDREENIVEFGTPTQARLNQREEAAKAAE